MQWKNRIAIAATLLVCLLAATFGSGVLAQGVTPIQPDIPGRFVAAGPALAASNLASCGTAPTIVGNDTAGKITVGTNNPTSCVLTFTRVFAVAPSCQATNETSSTTIQRPVTTTSTVTFSTAVTAEVVSYSCMGRQ